MIARSTLLAAVLAVSTTSAFAAVKDTDPVSLLPKGTVLVTKTTIAVKPHQSEIALTPEPPNPVPDRALSLWLHIEASPRDRELNAGTRWKFDRVDTKSDYYGVFLRGCTEGGSVIAWQFSYYGKKYVAPTIGELKTFFDVELPSPDIIPAE